MIQSNTDNIKEIKTEQIELGTSIDLCHTDINDNEIIETKPRLIVVAFKWRKYSITEYGKLFDNFS